MTIITLAIPIKHPDSTSQGEVLNSASSQYPSRMGSSRAATISAPSDRYSVYFER